MATAEAAHEPRGEIVNPSDRATVSIADPEAACLAVLWVGRGAYGIKSDELEMPLLIEGRINHWIRQRFGCSLEELLDRVSRSRLSSALRTFRLEGERTSLNDFVARAHALAEKLERPCSA